MTIPEDILCPACAYDLRGATGDRCPACGHSLENLRSTTSRIPWVHRKELGFVWAYWQTVWMVTFRNRSFCEEYARPVSYPDARFFLADRYLPLAVISPGAETSDADPRRNKWHSHVSEIAGYQPGCANGRGLALGRAAFRAARRTVPRKARDFSVYRGIILAAVPMPFA